MVFCTLFDSNYLDKGLVLFDSLKKVIDDFKLYVIAFDDKCYEVLSDIADKRIVPISMKEFETEELLIAKSNRTRGEYCWTCSCFSIAYVLDNYEDICTYIDADLYFYSNPQCVIDEMIEHDCQVQIIEQRLDNRRISRELTKKMGKYCIEFNTFTNDSNSRKILRWWQDRCLECCTATPDGKIFGDQKYLDDWLERFEGVNVVENVGAGVAPWNITNYELERTEGDNIYVKYKPMDITKKMVFFHFHSVHYLDEEHVDIKVFTGASHTSEELVKLFYYPYLKKIQEKREYLSSVYGVDYSIPEKHLTRVVSMVKSFNFREIIVKLRGYSLMGLLQYLWYKKNRKKDILCITEILSEDVFGV